MDDYKNKVQNKYENTNLFEEQQELYDYLTKKESRTLNKLDKVIEYNEQTKNKDLTYNIFNTIVFNMYTNCRDVMIDLSKKKKIHKVFQDYNRKIYVGITIIVLAFFLMLFYF